MNSRDLLSDLFASVVVFLVALPLCMGVAIASDVPPAMGLIAGIIGGIVVGSFAGSPLQVSGPAAGLVVVCYEIVHTHGVEVLTAIVAVAGLMQVLAGTTGIAQWFRAVAPAVIYAMLAGIGVLIFASQFHVMVDDAPQSSGIMNLLTIPGAIEKGLLHSENTSHHVAARIGAFTFAILVVWNAIKEKLPGGLSLVPAPLLAVVAATGVSYGMDLNIAYVEAPSSFSSMFKMPGIEAFSALLQPGVLAEAFAVAVIASAESLLCATAVDKLHKGPRTDYDKELRAQGIGNMVSGMLGGLPITGVIVRSSANVAAGGTSRRSAILHGIWLLIAVAVFPQALAFIPRAALAAILVHIGIKLMNPSIFKTLAERSKWDAGIFVTTVFLIVSFNLLEGLMIGFALSILRLAHQLSHLEVEHLEREGEDGHKIIDLHLKGTASFVGLPKLSTELESAPVGSEIHVHMDELQFIDHACLELLGQWETQLKEKDCVLVVEWSELEQRALATKPKVGLAS